VLAAAQFALRLRAGQTVLDADFDALLPESQRVFSYRFWTPVRVAARASSWLTEAGATRVLDVGAGVGKFCLVGGLSSSLRFVGLEQLPELVQTADQLAHAMGIDDQVCFVQTDALGVALPSFDALYFYNPFDESTLQEGDSSAARVESRDGRLAREVAWAEQLLQGLPAGVLVVTYNGFGGRVPDSFDLQRAQAMGLCVLRLWRKSERAGSGGHWVEATMATELISPDEDEAVLVLPHQRSARQRLDDDEA
jgi:SAM-dependent methyltransferase